MKLRLPWVFNAHSNDPRATVAVASPSTAVDRLSNVKGTYTLQVTRADGGHVIVVHQGYDGLGNFAAPRAVIVPDGDDMVKAITAIMVTEKLTK